MRRSMISQELDINWTAIVTNESASPLVKPAMIRHHSLPSTSNRFQTAALPDFIKNDES